ncbi:hypothetical protein HMPREF0290_1224 [Corynebacterium efficiens YS-314]|nr:hypothetical protein HMPREF0290_1224 [Corynebacterium efficiens YS-314]
MTPGGRTRRLSLSMAKDLKSVQTRKKGGSFWGPSKHVTNNLLKCKHAPPRPG